MYNEVYAAWQREIDDPTLQPLPADFYTQVAKYVQNIKKQAQMLDKKALKTLLLEQELKNVSRIVRQLTWMRYKKLVKIINAGGKMPLDSLTDEEAHLVKGCLPVIDSYRAFVKTLLQGEGKLRPKLTWRSPWKKQTSA